MSKPFDVQRAIVALERRENLRSAEENAVWVVRRYKYVRLKSKNERETIVHDALSCLHGTSYTLPCSKCKRSQADADYQRTRIEQKLKNQ